MKAVADKKISGFVKDVLSRPDFSFIAAITKAFPAAQVYLVGGIVRDLLIGRESKDYDFVVRGVDAKDLEKLLAKHGDVNLVGKSFGVFKFKPKNGMIEEEIDIALPRTEHSLGTGGYRDFNVQSDASLPIEKDLERRDFTVNAMALDLATGELVDPFGGSDDIGKKIIRTVGKPEERFSEDFTRMLRAVRFFAQLGFTIEPKTYAAVEMLAPKIKTIPAERIQADFTKIIMSPRAFEALVMLQRSGLLAQFIPELEEGLGVGQNGAHIYDVFEHNARALAAAVDRGYTFEVRLAALFHDIAKPETKEGEGKDCTFYNHEVVGKPKTAKVLRRLKYPEKLVDVVSHLVRHHMFYYSLGEITDAAVRRLIARVGKENMEQLIQLRMCDRLGMGRPKAKPYKLLELEQRVQIVNTDPVSVKMLAIDGHDIMDTLKIEPSIRIKRLQQALLSEVLDDPKKNTKEYQLSRIAQLHTLTDEELQSLAPDFEELEQERKQEIIKKYKPVA